MSLTIDALLLQAKCCWNVFRGECFVLFVCLFVCLFLCVCGGVCWRVCVCRGGMCVFLFFFVAVCVCLYWFFCFVFAFCFVLFFQITVLRTVFAKYKSYFGCYFEMLFKNGLIYGFYYFIKSLGLYFSNVNQITWFHENN